MRPKVCVLILNWNGAGLMRKYLPALIEHTPSALAEIVVADNGSTDDSEQVVRSHGVGYIRLDANYGFAEGYNRAIRMVEHEYICLLNSDVRVTSHWLEPMLDFMQSHPYTVAVQPRLRWDRLPSSYEYAGAHGGYMDRWGYPFCRGRIFETLEPDEGQYGDEPLPVTWTSGACMLVRRREYVEVGGLEPAFFAHQEEIDLCWRWLNRGYDLYIVPSSIVYHYGGASLSTTDPRKTYLNFRNNLLMLYRNLPPDKRGRVLSARLLLDRLAALVYVLKGKSKDAKAVLCAWRDYRVMRSRIGIDVGGDCDLGYAQLYPHSLLVRYHLWRERTYTQLKK